MSIIHDSAGSAVGKENPLPIYLTESTIMQPVDIQGHYQTTIQTHNAVNVVMNGNSIGSWIDCNGFDKIAICLKNDASTSSNIGIHWSYDGVAQIGNETTPNSSSSYQQTAFEIKARYARVYVNNLDATLDHVMSVWAYLKA